MANASVTQHITRHTVAQALAQARRDCASSVRWLNAVNRAALELEVGGWQFDGETLRMPSATNPSARCTVNEHGCSCKAGQAGKPCKHRAAWRLLIKAAEIAATAQRPRKSYAEVLAEANECI